jgi:hypothetical protein
VPFGEKDTDIEGHIDQATGGLAHIVGRFVSVRSGQANLSVPLVPEFVGELVETKPIEFAIGFEPTGHMPTLTMDIFEQSFGRVPTVELDINLPAWGQQGAQFFQYRTRQTVFAAKGQAMVWGSLAIEPTHGLGPQIEPYIDRHHNLTNP